jgi:hypothetical protein
MFAEIRKLVKLVHLAETCRSCESRQIVSSDPWKWYSAGDLVELILQHEMDEIVWLDGRNGHQSSQIHQKAAIPV